MNDNMSKGLHHTRILIVDDHPIVREGLALFLNLQQHLTVCCEAANADEALAAISSCRHELAIVDISLNGDSGLHLIKVLRSGYPSLAILALSMHDESLFAERALRAGANGYLMKQAGTRQILSAIQEIMSGHIYLSSTMPSRLKIPLAAAQMDQHSLLSALTAREFEILHLIGQGLGARQIADKLNRSVKTIEAHRASLKEKLQLENGRDLDRFAVQWLGTS